MNDLALPESSELEESPWPDCLTHFNGGQGTIDTRQRDRRTAEFVVVRDSWALRELDQFMVEHAKMGTVLGLDSETNAQRPESADYRCRLIQIADDDMSWVIVLEDLDPDDRGYLTKMIREYPRFVAAPAEVDLRFIHNALPGAFRFGEQDPHVVCLQVALAFHDPRTVVPKAAKDGLDIRVSRLRGLKDTTTRELTPVLAEIEKAMHARWRELAPKGHRTPTKCRQWGFANVPSDDPTYLAYSALDPLMTVRLWNKFVRSIIRNGQMPGFLDFLREQWWIDQQTVRGIAIDGTYAKWLDRQLNDLVDYHAKSLAVYDIKPSGSGPAVGEAFTRLGVPVMKRTKGTNNPSWDKEVIKQLAAKGTTKDSNDDPAVRALAGSIQAVRQATKFGSAYVAPMLEALETDGRVHWSHRAVGTVSSRQSAARPALHQQPKKDTRVRAAYRADPGFVIVSCDLSQGEPRCMAALAQDDALLADIYSGDLNGAIAATAFGNLYIPAEGKLAGTASYIMRQGGKAGFLAKCYGGGVRRVDSTVGVPEGTNIGRPWERRYHKLFAYSEELNSRASVVLENGWVIPLWDRFIVDEDDGLRLLGRQSRKGLNYETQGSQRMLLQRCWLRLVEMGWGWAGFFWLHDEIFLHVPEFMAVEAREALREAMTFTWRGVRFECDPEINGRTWMPQPDTFDPGELSIVEELEDAA